ncbi:hypothetical protein PRUPE_5G040500 [Prunus persica]|uniref:Uncharacterized protein n=1 Tax=Prunus persica TaxID=3760 RepID=M5WC78_PRUPE|nr:hypothetical protein PRUPE_5G040500 [Prunus persica]
MDTDNWVSLVHTGLVKAPLFFDQNVNKLLKQVCSKAYVNLPLYAHGNLSLSIYNKYSIYDAAKCTRDLSSQNCMKCLDVAIEKRLSQSHGRRGGQVYYGSCYIIFELYSF